MPNPVPFSRGGGPSLGGIEQVTRTDKGWWTIAYKGINLRDDTTRRRAWNAMRASVNGMADTIAIPVWSYDANGLADGVQLDGQRLVTHSDGSSFRDGGRYRQAQIIVTMAEAAAIGDTSVALRLVYGIDELSGVRFSYQHALYETGNPTSVVDDVWTVKVFPAVRAAIPQDAALELDLPTCLVHLASDREMDMSLSAGNADKVDVNFVEATSYWNALASV
jgi:hypothetical protein